ncbi:class I SAM-dependent methyltransferase [Kibdelosporangium philippinense]|uniref:Class I SAM-dependent methyltransferase n=1 Tax=Kibdelosporangium philippinense TaxID=211113 RepID=A0ABS8ZHK1_9PSEU|nr:class I SAM-dependent methyltransferase [Kibdelosporangium philippinense]MCE7007290.1 class I SAM-dependent methyltransferase [Kibdelosporangium philippinense]
MKADYTAAAEFYELVADRQVRVSGPPLTTALSTVDPSTGPVVEIGAGTGRITEVISAALPDTRVLAAEPCPSMRAVLTSRVFTDPGLRDRVTVVADSVNTLALPEQISAVVLFGVVNHLPPAERVDLLRRLGARMPETGPIVVELMGGRYARRIPRARILRESIGELTYEWWAGAEAVAECLLRWRTVWKVFAGEELVRVVRDEYEWATVGLDELAEEAGLRCRLLGPEIGVFTR